MFEFLFLIVCRYNPEGCISGLLLGKAAHRLVLQTINAQPDNTHMSSEAALCPNTIFHNQQVSERVLTFQGKQIRFQSEITRKKENGSLGKEINENVMTNKLRCRNEITEAKKKREDKRPKAEEKTKRNLANIIVTREAEIEQGNKGESNVPQSEVTEEERVVLNKKHLGIQLTQEENKVYKIARSKMTPKEKHTMALARNKRKRRQRQRQAKAQRTKTKQRGYWSIKE